MKKAIVVLGFHRSGTSALAGVLSCLGAYAGNDPIPPSPENERGFFENMRVYEANEYILNELCGLKWNDLSNPKLQVDYSAVNTMLHFSLSRTFGDNPVIVVKDPRICLLIPAYRSVLRDLGYEVHFIRTFRPADEICLSIALRYGVEKDHGMSLIKAYNKLVTEEEPNAPVVTFSDLLSGPDGVIESLKVALPFLNFSEEGITAAKRFLDPNLKHF